MAGYENYGLESGKLVNPNYVPHFLELSEDFPDEKSPLLDQKTTSLKNLSPDQRQWRDHGYVIKRNFIPGSLIDEYIELRNKLNLGDGSFPDCHPHLYSSVIRDMCCSRELHYLLVDLIGEEMGLHFSLNGFKSSERGWHQDDYLNPENTMGRYVAVWMAMGDIHPDSGPFEFVPGSHKWPCLRREKVKALVKPEAHCNIHELVTAAEYLVNKSTENYIRETGSEVVQFIAKKGDMLIWHAKTMHRGSIPENPNLIRPALISHYSAIRDRTDLGSREITRHGDGGYFWEFSSAGEVLTHDRIMRRDNSCSPDRVKGEYAYALENARAEVERLRVECSDLQSIVARTISERDGLAAASNRWFDAVIAVTPHHNPAARASPQRSLWWRKVARRINGGYGRPSPTALGNRARDAEQWELAVRYYRDALDVSPDDPEIWAECGHALKQAGKTSEAELAYKKSRELTIEQRRLCSTDATIGGNIPSKAGVPTIAANGADIPLLGLGTLFLSGTECVHTTETALSLGYRHIDTAVMYGNEVDVGNAIRSSGIARSELFITTKVLPEEVGEGDLQRSAAGSLQRLGMDYVDLLLLHWPNAAIPLSASIKALCDAKKLGLTRHIGVSNFPTELVEAAVVHAADHGERLAANQCEYHPRLNQGKVLEVCRANGIGFISHTPLGQGRLIDDPMVVTIARRARKTPAQVLLRWNIQQPGVVAIAKSAQQARLAENLQVFDFELSDEDMKDLFEMAAADERMVYPVNVPVPEWDAPIALTAAMGGRDAACGVRNHETGDRTLGTSRAYGASNSGLATDDVLRRIGKDDFVENYFVRDLERFVRDEAFHFDENAMEWYYKPAEETMDIQWQYVQSFLSRHPIDYSTTMELSCGHGRNSERLSMFAKNLILVDVVPENILFCKTRFPDKPWKYVINNGFDLREIASNSITFVYCFEAAVHFDLEIILSYIKEFRRVMAPSALGFIHHSNVTANPGKDWRTIPHGRNFMSKEIFAHLCIHDGLKIVDQHVFHQGGPDADCFSLFQKCAD